MSEIKIEKNVPFIVPKRGAQTIYPYAQMEVGDSFVYPKDTKNPYSMAKAAGFSHGKKFSVTRLPDKTYRCWRIA